MVLNYSLLWILVVLWILDGYCLTQAKFSFNLLSKAGLTNSKITTSPFEYNTKLLATGGSPLLAATLCWQLVGSLIYLPITKFNVLYVVNLVN